MKRDKVNLDIFWLKDEALEESANLPAPEIIAADIAADLEAALEQFAAIAEDLKGWWNKAQGGSGRGVSGTRCLSSLIPLFLLASPRAIDPVPTRKSAPNQSGEKQ